MEMDEKQQIQDEKRALRRKRRIRNQILAYGVLIILIFAVATGIVVAVRQITVASHRQEQENKEESQNMIDDILAGEGELQTPEPGSEPEQTSEPIAEMTPQEKLDEIVDAAIGVMPLEDKVAGLFIVTPEDITGVSTAIVAGDGTRDALSKYAVGGLIYFRNNMRSADQLKDMLDNTKLYTRYPLFIAVDEEGGNVTRLTNAGLMDAIDSAWNIGQTGDPNNAYAAGVTIGSTLNSFGFNLDFAPVADISSVENSYMGDRTYGSDAQTATPFVTAMMQGLKDKNVTACLKHFPGNGATTQDPHTGIATSQRTAEEFRAEEFVVFKAGIDAGVDMIMVSHMAAPALTGDNDPCSLSSEVVTDILREELGFDGVIITDALNMGAVSDYYPPEDAAVMALKAGCDILLMPEDFETAYNAVLEAVRNGTISEERINDSLRRIYRIKYADRMEPQD